MLDLPIIFVDDAIICLICFIFKELLKHTEATRRDGYSNAMLFKSRFFKKSTCMLYRHMFVVFPRVHVKILQVHIVRFLLFFHFLQIQQNVSNLINHCIADEENNQIFLPTNAKAVFFCMHV